MHVPQVIDSHVHLWDPGALEYPWLAALPALGRPFLGADLNAATAALPVGRVIFVEANARPDQALAEVALAEGCPRVAGIVAFAPLDRPEALPARLDALCERPRVRGVRQNIQGNAPGFALRRAFVEGVREVGRRGLSFDLCATHDQLAEVVELCRLCPGTRLVLDHCGKPPIREGGREPWAAQVAELAAMEHVWCKLSGLLTEADPERWREEDLLPYAEHVLERFGAGRVMYGSDWPVLTLAGEYGAWYRFTRRLADRLDAGEARAFYHDSAVSFYRLPA